jgi:mannose-6-phosphate isomerase-like protein (cupin superfamily)
LLGENLRKGYDFFVCEFEGEADELIPWHRHRRSAEFFYILEGKLIISIDDTINEVHAGEFLLVPATKMHSIHLSVPCKFITIAKPSLFSRMGKIYDKLRKKKQ